MQRGKMHPDWMRWIPCSVKEWNPIECSGFHAAWRNGTLLNAVDFMQHGPKHPDRMQWIPCIVIEWSVIHAAWLNASRLNAVYSIQRDWMKCIPCSVTKWNPIECSGFYAARLNAVDFMQHGPMHPDWMQWITCIVIECSVLHAAW